MGARHAAEFDRRLLDKLQRDLGPKATVALQDPSTIELMLNPDGRLWVESLGAPMRCIGQLDAARARAVIQTLASHLGKTATGERPLLEGELPPSGARFAGQLPPVVTAPAFSIRKPAVQRLTLDDYVAQGALCAAHGSALRCATRERKNILIVGGTGSGKTTLASALICEMVRQDPAGRIVLIEDTREIACDAQNSVQLHTTASVPMTQLLRATLRMRPDRILVGEVRGPEALDLLMAWNTGHPGGIATVHANDALGGLSRLSILTGMHPDAPREPDPLIAQAVDVLVHIERTARGRRVQQIVQVLGHGAGGYQTTPL